MLLCLCTDNSKSFPVIPQSPSKTELQLPTALNSAVRDPCYWLRLLSRLTLLGFLYQLNLLNTSPFVMFCSGRSPASDKYNCLCVTVYLSVCPSILSSTHRLEIRSLEGLKIIAQHIFRNSRAWVLNWVYQKPKHNLFFLEDILPPHLWRWNQ